MSKKTIVVIANLDTRGEEFRFVKRLIEAHGHRAVLLDFSMKDEPPYAGDVPCDVVARRGGAGGIEEVRRGCINERKKYTDVMVSGAVSIVKEMYQNGELDGLLGVGGATASAVATRIMRQLPFGLPKVMASSIASNPAYVSEYVGTRDITLHHTVVDVSDMNSLLRRQLINLVGAICGMVEIAEAQEQQISKPPVAITAFGFSDNCVRPVISLVREKGYEPVPFHAQGAGDRAMDELIRDGFFAGVIDVVTRGIGEQLFQGNCAAGNDRLLAASESGIPQVVSLSGLDMLSYGSRPDLAARSAGRKAAPIDALRVEVRTKPEELEKIAEVMAERLNKATAPATVMIPLKGWSSLSEEGRPLHDPEADFVLVNRLKQLVKPYVRLRELNLALDTREFACAMVEEFDALYKQRK